MIRLIKNELFRIMHKKSTIIFLIIALIYILLTNIIYKKSDMLNSLNYVTDYYYYDIETAKEYLNETAPTIENALEYAEYRSFVDAYNLAINYKEESWQYKKYMEEYKNIDNNYIFATINNDYEEANKYKVILDEIKENIDNNDWHYFVNNKINELKEDKQLYTELMAETKNNEEIIYYQKEILKAEEEIKLNEYRLKEDICYGNDYINTAIAEIKNLLFGYAEYTIEKNSDYEEDFITYNKNQYILQEKEDINNRQTLRGILINFFGEYSFLILVFVIMIAGGLVSEEFNKGTIKSLLIIPKKREKILLAKYISAILFIPLVILILFIVQLLIGGIFFGYSSLNIPVVVYNLAEKQIETINVFKYFGLYFITSFPKILLLTTLAFACSVILNNTAFAIALTFCGIIASDLINSFALFYEVKILNYFVTTNWNFSEFLFGGTSTYGNSLTHSIIVCLMYLVIMIIAMFIVFKKKDVKNV